MEILILLLIFQTVVADPRVLAWSPRTYGPDGPWQAVQVKIGTPGQPIDLYPGSAWQSHILAASVCDNTTLSPTCYAKTAGVYNISKSTSNPGDVIPFGDAVVDWAFGTMIIQANSEITFDTLDLVPPNPGTQDAFLPNLSMHVLNSAYQTLPDGTAYPVEVGALSLGAPTFYQVFDSKVNGTLLPNYLYMAGQIPSMSYGLHIGSASLGIPGSLLVGGYDQTRVVGDVSVQPYGSNFISIDLFDIGFGVAEGSSPLSFSSKNGYLARGNSSVKQSVNVYVDSSVPYMYLPPSTCAAFAQDLPLVYQSKYGLYFWNTSDPRYEPLISSPSYLGFALRQSLTNANITIKVPFKLLNLTLQAPIIDPPVPYFPCMGTTGQYTLGRAFLQAAFVGVNWQNSNTNGSWFLAQAPGPNTPTTAVITPINDLDHSITPSTNQWIDSWRESWTPIGEVANNSSPSNQSSSSSSTTTNNTPSNTPGSTSGLSSGAKAGIGVGCSIAGLLFLASAAFALYRRRQQRKADHLEASRSIVPPPTTAEVENPRRWTWRASKRYPQGGFGPRELETTRAWPGELDGGRNVPPAELADTQKWSPAELSSSKSIR